MPTILRPRAAGAESLTMGVLTRYPQHSRGRPRLGFMDNRAEVREFLMSRRAKVTPADAGLAAGANRRVAGLRRTEVALLAGVSVEYYAKLERGAIAGASASVLEAIAEALQLDDTERAHLFDLARAADGIPTSGRARRRGPPGARHAGVGVAAVPDVGAGRHHRRCRVRSQPAAGPAGHQRPRTRLLPAAD